MSNLHTEFQRFTTAGERRVARALIRAILDKGYSISVCDGEEWPVKRARHLAEVTDALATTGEDLLLIRREDGSEVGWFAGYAGDMGGRLVTPRFPSYGAAEEYAEGLRGPGRWAAVVEIA